MNYLKKLFQEFKEIFSKKPNTNNLWTVYIMDSGMIINNTLETVDELS